MRGMKGLARFRQLRLVTLSPHLDQQEGDGYESAWDRINSYRWVRRYGNHGLAGSRARAEVWGCARAEVGSSDNDGDSDDDGERPRL